MFYFDPVCFFCCDLAYFWNKPSSLRFDFSNLWNKQTSLHFVLSNLTSLRFDLSNLWNKQNLLRFDLSNLWNKQNSLCLIFLRCRISRVRFTSIFTSSGKSRFVSLRYRKRSQDLSFVPPSFRYLAITTQQYIDDLIGIACHLEILHAK